MGYPEQVGLGDSVVLVWLKLGETEVRQLEPAPDGQNIVRLDITMPTGSAVSDAEENSRPRYADAPIKSTCGTVGSRVLEVVELLEGRGNLEYFFPKFDDLRV